MSSEASNTAFRAYVQSMVQKVDAALDAYLPAADCPPASIHAAMRYTIFAGGKRLRPILTLAAAEACGGSSENALAAACAVEMLHTYSLVHDDLPCMDDDDLRRGRPTCHKVYGEGLAVLCGDALLTEAFLVLSKTPATSRYAHADHIKELALTGSSRQLIGGQVLDLESEGKRIDMKQLETIHRCKTAALLTCSLRLGAMTADATTEQLEAISQFGQALGLAFQVIDDILDVTQSSEILGKTAGKDVAAAKATYPAMIGLEASRKMASELTQKANQSLKIFGSAASHLQEMADSMLLRHY